MHVKNVAGTKDASLFLDPLPRTPYNSSTMKSFIRLHLPILGTLVFQGILLFWAVRADGRTLPQVASLFSLVISILILITGLLPAIVRPQESHTIVACFAISFAFLLFIPFEISDMPFAQPGAPLIQFMPPLILSRLINGSILLPMAIHMSARFPRRNSMPTRMIVGAYIFSIVSLFLFLIASNPWQRLIMLMSTLGWFLVAIAFFFINLLRAARDTENLQDAQRARIVFFSIAVAEIPLLMRPFSIALNLDALPYNVVLFFQLFVPLGISYAVLRHDLFGIDRVLRRTLAYGTVSILLLTLYLALTTGMTALFADSLTSRPIAPLVSLFIAAILFEPTRKFVQTWLDRILYPDRLRFQNAVQEIQNSLARANRREQIIHLLNEIFPAQIGAEWGALKLFPEPDVPPPHLTPGWNTRLIAGSVSFGGYWLGTRKAGPLYDSDERARLSALGQQAAFALAYANAYENLYALNQTLEERVKEQTQLALANQKSVAAYEERQRIARDLHDSVTQSLFGMHLMARGLAAKSTPEMREDLVALETQARETLREMRLLLDQLRNAAAEENVNLTEAVQGVCETFAQRSGPEGGPLLSITLEMPKGVILQKSIADEALWVIRESLQNIIKHSESRDAKVTVQKDAMLHGTIRDFGKGFDVNNLPAGHYGLRGMRERVLALGGELKIDFDEGTVVSFTLPLPAAP
ncbi:sensor histidine kinase [Candidatus Villigracilis affinis]|uniref:sensor histidine kinase n=1 Tax=Candidatus Villigracilis affinis TaxID=3140682 RepID=UPI002A1AC46C|nr:sensor histidine kinase [Anaerolineales bacterium]